VIFVSELSDALLFQAAVQWLTNPGYPYQFLLIFQNHIRGIREQPAYDEALTRDNFDFRIRLLSNFGEFP